jgi:hypothetical protein
MNGVRYGKMLSKRRIGKPGSNISSTRPDGAMTGTQKQQESYSANTKIDFTGYLKGMFLIIFIPVNH